MSLEHFLRLDGMKGPSVVEGFANQIPVLSYSFSANNQIVPATVTSPNPGRTNFNALAMT